MADILLTLNGIGHGHLVRAVQISRWLRRRHRRPVIFLQGDYPEELSLRVPGAGIWPLYQLPPATAQLVIDQIASYAALNAPAVVIEDTHPSPVSWPSGVIRFLVVRPAAFSYMSHLHAQHDSGIARVIVCDHPESPSWPYDAAETKAILGWTRWSAIGPIYRGPTHRGLALMRDVYRLNAGEPMFVFTLGGGGQRPGSNDCVSFIERALPIAARLRELWPRARLMFVCGPLFPPDIAIPSLFEVVRFEPDLPSLLKLAHGAVIRPGFNVMWECIAAQTPFTPLPGTTYAEPVQERLTRLLGNGIDHAASAEQWADPGWRIRYRNSCDAATARFSGDPATKFIEAFDDGIQERQSARPRPGPPQVDVRKPADDRHEELKARLRENSGPKQLLIRLDDVISDGPVIGWLIRMCAERSLPVSLEVIPYFSRLNGRSLDALDRNELCEVSQHGYAHIPHANGGPSGRGEFAGHAIRPSGAAAALLSRGRRLLMRTYGDRFKGGYSAPYDGWPEGIPSLWFSLGGRYVSWIVNRPGMHGTAQVQLGIDVWDWRANAPKSPAAILARCSELLRRRAPIGLVLHPQCLDSGSTRADLERLLDALLDGGCSGEFISRAAIGSSDKPVLHRQSNTQRGP